MVPVAEYSTDGVPVKCWDPSEGVPRGAHLGAKFQTTLAPVFAPREAALSPCSPVSSGALAVDRDLSSEMDARLAGRCVAPGGAVAVTLMWDTGDALDLHVRLPEGLGDVSLSRPRCAGAVLETFADGDALTSWPLVHVHWPGGSEPPQGDYAVSVQVREKRSSAPTHWSCRLGSTGGPAPGSSRGGRSWGRFENKVCREGRPEVRADMAPMARIWLNPCTVLALNWHCAFTALEQRWTHIGTI